MADRDTVSDWHARQDAARRAMADHGLGCNADNFARLPEPRPGPIDPLALFLLGGTFTAGALLGWLALWWWG